MAFTLPARTLRLEAQVSVSPRIVDLPVRLLTAIHYLDPARISTARLEFATVEYQGRLFVLTATINDGRVVGVSLEGGAAAPLTEGSVFRPLARAAFKHDNIDVDSLDKTPISIEDFVKGLRASAVQMLEPGTREWQPVCWVTVRVIDFGDNNLLICFYVCGRWATCVHIAPDK